MSFGNYSLAILPYFGDGIADIGEVGNTAPATAKVAAGGLSPTLQQMADHHTLCQFIPIIPLPAQFMDHWCKEESRISNSAGQHDIGTCIECFDQGTRSQISTGKEKATLHSRNILPCIHM